MKVEIYTKPHCPFCERAKQLLHIKGVAFVEYAINGEALHAEEIHRRAGNDSVPRIFIADRLIGGCAELFELDEKGLLDHLLTASP